MPERLLQRLITEPLPALFDDRAEIERLRRLQDAGYVRLEAAQEGDEPGRAAVMAVEVTALGRAALRYLGRTA